MNLVRTNRVLTFCWREWRAQRGVLLAYTGMGLAALCLVFLLMPEHWWRDDGRRALALAWFVVVGVIGVIAFVAPALVRGEYGAKTDQFVRRLPGALLPSFGGKLLFLALAAVAMPLVCLLVGEGFLLAIGEPWHDLFAWEHSGSVYFVWPWPIAAAAPVALLIPWVWAIGTWLPGGRMALGGTILFVLLLGLGVFAVLRQSPNIEEGIAWQEWLWLVPVVGLAAAAVSWTQGRRGGGPLRSARFGLTAAAIGFAPPSVWLADRVWDYHHPDLQRLVRLYVHGTAPDGRFLLAGGAEHENFNTVPLRIDLRDGSAHQLGSCDDVPILEQPDPPASWPVGVGRFWRIEDYASRDGDRIPCDLLDLTSGERTRVVRHMKQRTTELPEAIAREVAAASRALTPLRAPGGRRAWFEGRDVCIEGEGGSIDRVRWDGPLPLWVRACGHGMRCYLGKAEQLFDLTTRRSSNVDDQRHWHWLVQGTRISTEADGAYRWERHRDGVAVPIAELDGCGIHGLVDDERLLCSSAARRSHRSRPMRLFLWRVGDGVTTELPLPATTPAGASIDLMPWFGPVSSLLPRDPAGRIWLRATSASDVFLLLDATTLTITTVKGSEADTVQNGRRSRQLLSWPDAESAIVQDGANIVRIDVDTGERTVLFPRP